MTPGRRFPLPPNSPEQQIEIARNVLRALRFDSERSNERSALVLLALLGLTPGMSWAQATNEPLRIVQIMTWIRDNYEKPYAPNTRETIRKFTLHQFRETALIEENPGTPERPTNSPNYCYRVTLQALALLQGAQHDKFEDHVGDYIAEIPGLVDIYARARIMQRIPVTFPDGRIVTLSPGGQNILLKQIIENFCEYFTPGGQVLYIGDADTKWTIFDEVGFTRLNITVNQHGKMPDLVIYLPERNWLVLLEAASSHGPVDGKRREELSALFAGSTAGLVYVSCFHSREDMRRFLSQIAWESEVWCADNPTHLIHFNGERFLGPY